MFDLYSHTLIENVYFSCMNDKTRNLKYYQVRIHFYFS